MEIFWELILSTEYYILAKFERYRRDEHFFPGSLQKFYPIYWGEAAVYTACRIDAFHSKFQYIEGRNQRAHGNLCRS